MQPHREWKLRPQRTSAIRPHQRKSQCEQALENARLAARGHAISPQLLAEASLVWDRAAIFLHKLELVSSYFVI